ncbi:MAG TPA: IS110 family transposase [Thermoleophilaceae bacterium]|nr:IS110 family transposase [Thermoleophilaceae bacterium]
MMVIGVDPHKQTHTAAAVDGQTAELLGDLPIRARDEDHEQMLTWARSLDSDRTWAIEDCRHVSGGLERFLIRSGERVVRVPPKLTAGARRSEREPGKSDPIDALAIARTAIREPDLPTARLSGPEREITLLLDDREHLVAERTRIQQRLRWLLHDLDPRLEVPARTLDGAQPLKRLSGRSVSREQTTQVRIRLELVRRCAELARRATELEAELRTLFRRETPHLLAVPGCGTLTAAKLIAEVAGADRFADDPKPAKLADVAPLDASSGKHPRHRLDRSGNRQLNLALHRIAITQARIHARRMEYLARRQAEGKTWREALKRHLPRTVFCLLQAALKRRTNPARIQLRTAPLVPCLT